MNKHVRYVLPLLPFLLLLAGSAGLVWQRPALWPCLLVAVLLGWTVFAGLRAARDPLAYFNEAAGGPRGGIHHLAGSNLDWGQGQYRLLDWRAAHPEFAPVQLAYFGNDHYPIPALKLPIPPDGPAGGTIPEAPAHQALLGPHPGKYIVSARVVQGDAWTILTPERAVRTRHRRTFTYFQHFAPVATIGDSIYVYDISLTDANRVRARLGLAPLEPP